MQVKDTDIACATNCFLQTLGCSDILPEGFLGCNESTSFCHGSQLHPGVAWNRKEFTAYASAHLFPLYTSGGLRTSSADSEFHSFHAFWTEMKPQLFHISTATDRRTLLSAAVPMVLALPSGGAAMFTRSESTPGCGTLDGPSLAWVASLWPKLRSSD
jgi:hypothetical protein